MSFKKGKNGDDASDDSRMPASQSLHHGDEEVKQVKPTGKRGRPRKHPAAPFETHVQKSKRGRKPNAIKSYDLDPEDSSKIKLNVGFDDSDDDHLMGDMGPSPEVGPLESMLNQFGNGTDGKFIPSKPPSFQSPGTFLGPSRSPAPEFHKSKSMLVSSSPNLNSIPDDNPMQLKLNEIIAQSFSSWNNNEPKKRKDTEVDFAKQLYTNFTPSIAKNVKNIMSPDYKNRSFSINSNGWGLHKPSFDIRGRFSIDDFSEAQVDQFKKKGQDNARKLSSFHQGESKNQLLEVLKKNNNFKISPNPRKNTLIENPVGTLKQSSPLNFPKFSAAFKPFKKRSLSLHMSPHITSLMNENGHNGVNDKPSYDEVDLNSRKRETKYELKQRSPV